MSIQLLLASAFDLSISINLVANIYKIPIRLGCGCPLGNYE
jgi:hypothetical protein